MGILIFEPPYPCSDLPCDVPCGPPSKRVRLRLMIEEEEEEEGTGGTVMPSPTLPPDEEDLNPPT